MLLNKVGLRLAFCHDAEIRVKDQLYPYFCTCLTCACLSGSLFPESVSPSLSSLRVVTAEMFSLFPSINRRLQHLTPGKCSSQSLSLIQMEIIHFLFYGIVYSIKHFSSLIHLRLPVGLLRSLVQVCLVLLMFSPEEAPDCLPAPALQPRYRTPKVLAVIFWVRFMMVLSRLALFFFFF